jgi:hypothetical protein
MLLRRMADFQPELVEAAYAEMGATKRQYLGAHNRWQSMLISRRAPKELALYQAVLGPGDVQRDITVGDLILTAYGWRLPALWPDLMWETVTDAGGFVLNGALVRRDPERPAELPALDRLAPWSCVIDDAARLPDARQLDPGVTSRWVVQVGERRLMFVYGLFQTQTSTGAG